MSIVEIDLDLIKATFKRTSRNLIEPDKGPIILGFRYAKGRGVSKPVWLLEERAQAFLDALNDPDNWVTNEFWGEGYFIGERLQGLNVGPLVVPESMRAAFIEKVSEVLNEAR